MLSRLHFHVLLLSVLGLSVTVDADVPSDARHLLEQLMSVDTSNPPGNELAAVDIVATELKRAGIAYQIVPFSPGRGSVIARLRGNGKKRPLLLMAHLDVVGVAEQTWSVPPFALTEKGGWLYGRGVSDDKGWAAIATAVFIDMKQRRVALDRDLLLVLTSDEESGGGAMRKMIADKQPGFLDAEIALNEGGRIRLDEQGKVIAVGFQPAEKSYQDFRLSARGMGGHSSVPNDDNAIYRLARALDRIEALHFPPRLSDTVRGNLRAVAPTYDAPYRDALLALANSAKTGEPPAAAVAVLQSHTFLRALIRTTCVATLVHGGTRENSLPSYAEATVNCRVLPPDTVADTEAKLGQALAGTGVELSRVRDFGEGPAVPAEGLVPRAIAEVSHALFGKQVVVYPYVGTGASDSRFLRKVGVAAYGIDMLAKPDELTRGAHAADEAVPASSLPLGVKFLTALVEVLAK